MNESNKAWYGPVTETILAGGADVKTENARLVTANRDLQLDLDAWIKAALATRLCRADVDVSTPEKYRCAQAEAASVLLKERDRLRDDLAVVTAERDELKRSITLLNVKAKKK
jgi:hypothetical protein